MTLLYQSGIKLDSGFETYIDRNNYTYNTCSFLHMLVCLKKYKTIIFVCFDVSLDTSSQPQLISRAQTLGAKNHVF